MARDEADSTKKRRSRKRRALSMGRVLSLLAFLPVASRAPAYTQLIMALLVDGRMPVSRKALLAGGLGYIVVGRDLVPDDIPLIGRAPGHSNLWLATGHGMMGVGMSAGTGQLLADLIAGRTPAVDALPFNPARFA